MLNAKSLCILVLTGYIEGTTGVWEVSYREIRLEKHVKTVLECQALEFQLYPGGRWSILKSVFWEDNKWNGGVKKGQFGGRIELSREEIMLALPRKQELVWKGEGGCERHDQHGINLVISHCMWRMA